MKTIYSIICALCVICGLAACSDDHTGSMDVSGSCLVEKFVLNGQYEGIISTEKRLVKVKVPADFDQKGNMEITSLTVSPGAGDGLSGKRSQRRGSDVALYSGGCERRH